MKKLVVITGAGSGFGKAIAKKFIAAEYPVLLLDKDLSNLSEFQMPNVMCEQVDVSEYIGFENAVRRAEAIYGATDLLVNNAGVMLLGPIADQDSSEWKAMIDTNVIGVLNGMKIVEGNMKEAQHGTIINMASTAGVRSYENHAAYCATKFAIIGLTRTSQAEMAPYNVRVTAICPGAVSTGLLSHTSSSKLKEIYNKWISDMGIGSITPEEVAETVFFAYSLPQGVNLREVHITDTRQAN